MNQSTRIRFIVLAAMLSSIAIVLNYLEIPYFINYLKIDLSEVVVLVALTVSLPLAITVAVLKALFMSISTTSGYIGEIVLFIGSLTLIFSYKYARKITNKVVALIIMTLAFTIIMTGANYFVITPLYASMPFNEIKSMTTTLDSGVEITYFKYIVLLYGPFNLLKASLISVVFYIVDSKLKINERVGMNK